MKKIYNENVKNGVTNNLHELEDAVGRKLTPKGTPQRSPQSPNRTSGGVQQPSYNLRVKFQKVGRLQFISHLDLARTMRTAIVRAGIPVKYSEGFNPHPKMSFARQLSIGTESICEFMELKLTEEPDCERIKKELAKNLTDEMRILDVYVPERKPNEIGWAEYRIEFFPESSETVPLYSDIIADKLIVTKRTKSGEKEVDIRPQIREYSQNGNVLTAVLCADSTAYLNPEYIAKLAGIKDYSIMRTRVFLSDGVTEFR